MSQRVGKGGTVEKPGLARMAYIVPIVFSVVVAISSPAVTTFTTLASFDTTNGANPDLMSLVQGRDGSLYGTTRNGGANGFGGTVFKITPSGALLRLYSFCSKTNCADGEFPVTGLALATNGNFYGATAAGGASNGGTIFEITPSGALTTLYNFCSQTNCTDGDSPYGVLVQATDGNFYGTTSGGGAKGAGTIFKITPSGTLTTLYNFCSQALCADGETPYAGLVQDTNGNFYGTTYGGGAHGGGTVFKITSSGTLTTLHSFNGSDGAYSYAGLVRATNGNFYGTTSGGGAKGAGTVFKVTPSGTLTMLYAFCSQTNCADGSGPHAGLIQATDGNLYATTVGGGTNNGGTIFQITPSGTLTRLYNFCSQTNCTDGDNSYGGLGQDTNGKFYGTTYIGGDHGVGTVFILSVGLKPFIKLGSTSGKVGSLVGILGQGFGASSVVKFNGVTATIRTVTGTSYITATVPAGATDGYVTVTTGATTLTSTKKYTVHDSWASGASLPTPVRYPAGLGAINGKIYVVGGITTGSVTIATNQVYNTATNTWSTAAPLPTPVSDGAAAVVNGVLYVIGGYNGTSVVNSVYAYNPSTNTWTSRATMPTARASIGSALEKGLVYVIGGVNGDGVTRLAIVESYDPAANTWTSEAPLLVGKSEVSVGLAGSTILASDGYTTSADTGDNEGYNSTANAWKSLASDPHPRHDSCFGVISGLMYVSGGGLSPSVLNESYGVSSNKWTTLSSMPVATTAPGSTTWNGQLYCFGGGDSTGPTGGNFYNNVQIYQP